MKPTKQAPREKRFTGQAVAPGIAIGPLHEVVEAALLISRISLRPEEISQELARLDEAVNRSRRQVEKLKSRLAALPNDSEAEIAPLLDVYLHMLAPSRLLRGIRARIQDAGQNAEAAVHDEAEAQAALILAQTGGDKPGRVRRAEEVRELARRLVRNLTRQPFRSFAGLPQGCILAAEDLRPAEAALIQPQQFAGIVTAEGGIDGHTAVMLRALGLPTVLGVNGLLGKNREGCLAIIDGESGEVTLNPSKASLTTARKKLSAATRQRRALAQLQNLPARTRCGVMVELQANLELPFELGMIAESGAHGIGLVRSEFMYMNREKLPDENTLAQIYLSIVEAMDGDPVTIRLLDWGADKEIEALARYQPDSPEPNPAMGLRGIRVLLKHQDLLETQLAAILRAAAAGPVRVMLPMVSVVSEVTATREIMRRVWRRLKRRQSLSLPDKMPPMGIMVETPAAALAVPVLAQHTDFFAIGTNDLTMYTLAADRSSPGGVELYDPLEPAVLRLIHLTTSFAAAVGIPVSVCGEIASRPGCTPLLLGLGVRQFSMHANAVPLVKRQVRASVIAEGERLAAAALAANDAKAVRALIAQQAALSEPK